MSDQKILLCNAVWFDDIYEYGMCFLTYTAHQILLECAQVKNVQMGGAWSTHRGDEK
jgi:hypothetical protein